jgi:uncharacterized protein YfcZ (UPF0381/DUF406 family)
MNGTEIIDQIEILLRKQKDSIVKDNMNEFDSIGEQIEVLICKLKQSEVVLDKQQRETFLKLYSDISMAVEAQKLNVNKQIAQMKEHSKLLKAYSPLVRIDD